MNASKGTIVYIGGFEMPDKNAASHRVKNIAKILTQLDYKVVFCGVDSSISNDSYTSLFFDGYDSFPSKYPKNIKGWFKNFISFKHTKYVLDRYSDLKYVIAYNMHSIPLKKVLAYCKRKKIKIIADVTEWYGNYFSLNPLKFVKWLDTCRVMNHLNAKVDGIISVSTYLTNFYKDKAVNVVQIPPLVDTSDEIWKQHRYYTKENHRISFVYAGVPGKDKDRIDMIVKSVALHNDNDIVLNIIGLTRDNFINDYPSLTNLISLNDNKIVFHGRLSHQKSVLALLQNDYCIFFRNPSRKNNAGFPTKFVESVTSGIGIITNPFSDISSYFPLKNSFLIDDINEQTILNIIEKCVFLGKVNHSLSNTFDFRNYIRVLESFLETL